MENESILVKKSTIKDLIRNLAEVYLKTIDDAPESAETHRVHCQFVLLNLLQGDIEDISSDILNDLVYALDMTKSLGYKFDHKEQKVVYENSM